MGLGQEGRPSRSEDYGRRSSQASAGRSSGREGTRRTPGQSANYGDMDMGEDASRQRFGGYYRGRERDYGTRDYGREDYSGRDMGWERGNEGFQSSPRQRSQYRGPEGEFSGARQQYSTGPNTGWKSYNERYQGLGGRGWYEGMEDAMHREEGQFTGRGPRNYKRSDERIEEDINEQLTRHGRIDATEIEVSVQNGEVTLRGSVDNRQAKRMAEDIADSVSGVKEVTNQIKVRQRGDSGDKGESKHETEATGKQQRKAS